MDLNSYKKLAVLALLVLASCAEIKKEAEYIEKPAEQIYNSALDKVLARKFRASVTIFDEVVPLTKESSTKIIFLFCITDRFAFSFSFTPKLLIF